MYVLYVSRQDANSEIAIAVALSAEERPRVQYIEELLEAAEPLPEWLRGVPTLVCTHTGHIEEGSAVLHLLAAGRRRNEDVLPAPPAAATAAPAAPPQVPAASTGLEIEEEPPLGERGIDMDAVRKELESRGIGGNDNNTGNS